MLTLRPICSSNSSFRRLMACDQTWLIAMMRSGVFAEGGPPERPQALSAPAAPAPAARRTKPRRPIRRRPILSRGTSLSRSSEVRSNW